MHDDELIIRRAWRSLATSHRDERGPRVVRAGHDDLLEAVLARHREPHRRYHTITHVAWVIRTIDELVAVVPVPSLAIVHLAAIYHDAVYDPRATDNEARSADLAHVVGDELGWPVRDRDEVARLILATASHEVEPDDVAGAVLLDADLAVLGAEPAAYRAYATGVRVEYAHIDDATWSAGRAAVLRAFLERDHIFATAPMRAAREHRGRANLTAEIAGLRAP